MRCLDAWSLCVPIGTKVDAGDHSSSFGSVLPDVVDEAVA